jgi:hypothetical protein
VYLRQQTAIKWGIILGHEFEKSIDEVSFFPCFSVVTAYKDRYL